MDPSINYYAVLDVSESASQSEIKAAFRRLARQYHPDINLHDPASEERFKAINHAYGVLSDPVKRKQYDMLSKRYRPASQKNKPVNSPQSHQTASTQVNSPDSHTQKAVDSTSRQSEKAREKHSNTSKKRTQPKVQPDLSGSKFKVMFDVLFGQESKTRNQDGQPGKTHLNSEASPEPLQQTQNKRGEDIYIETLISEEEATLGVVKAIHIEQSEPCKRCSETGRVSGQVCTACQGEKKLIHHKKLDVRIPAGVKHGSKVRISKEGGRSVTMGEAPGDLYLMIQIALQTSLKVEGLHAYCEIDITIPQSVLGAEIEIPTLKGLVKMVIPPHTASGKVFRLKSQGATVQGVTGDQLVTVRIVPPKSLTPQQRSLYEELARLDQLEMMRKESPKSTN